VWSLAQFVTNQTHIYGLLAALMEANMAKVVVVGRGGIHGGLVVVAVRAYSPGLGRFHIVIKRKLEVPLSLCLLCHLEIAVLHSLVSSDDRSRRKVELATACTLIAVDAVGVGVGEAQVSG